MMDKHNLNKGFVLIEFIFVLIILSILFYFINPFFKEKNYDHFIFNDSYIYMQSLSLANKEDNMLDMNFNVIDYYTNIIFNEKGNVNQAQTIIVNNKKYTIGLGVGKLIEK